MHTMQLIEVGSLMYTAGLVGLAYNRTHVFLSLLGMELIYIGVTILFLATDDIVYGTLFALFLLSIAASESAVSLAIILHFFRFRESLWFNEYNEFRG